MMIDKDGYKLIKKHGHPLARKNGYILEHRYVAYEFIDKNLTKNQIVHHKNENRLDNRPENLEIISDTGTHVHLNHKEKQKKALLGNIPWNKGKYLIERTPEYIADRKHRAVLATDRWRKRHPEKYKALYSRYNSSK